jgi:hypothetical protein
MFFLRANHIRIADVFRSKLNKKFNQNLDKKSVRGKFHWFTNKENLAYITKDSAEYLTKVLEAFMDVGPMTNILPETYNDFVLKQISKLSQGGIGLGTLNKAKLYDVGNIPVSDLLNGTLVHDRDKVAAANIVKEIAFRQFRKGMGGVWFASEDDIENIIQDINMDAYLSGYSNRLALLDFTRLSDSDGLADRSRIKSAFSQKYLPNLANKMLNDNLMLPYELKTSREFILLFNKAFEKKLEKLSYFEVSEFLDLNILAHEINVVGIDCKYCKKLSDFLMTYAHVDLHEYQQVDSSVKFINSMIGNYDKILGGFRDSLRSMSLTISSFSDHTVSFDDAFSEKNKVIIVRLPKNEKMAKSILNLYEIHYSKRPAVIIDDDASKPVNKIESYTPVILGHPYIYTENSIYYFLSKINKLNEGVIIYQKYMIEPLSLHTSSLCHGFNYLMAGKVSTNKDVIDKLLSFKPTLAHALSYGQYDNFRDNFSDDGKCQRGFFVGNKVLVKIT